MPDSLPQLRVAEWQPTRDTLHCYAQMMGALRARHMPRSKHWWHITLSVSARGLITTPFPLGGRSVELGLDLVAHQMTLACSDGQSAALSLIGQSARGLRDALAAQFTAMDLALGEDELKEFDDAAPLPYDAEAVARYRVAINWIDGCFKRFKGELREESSPVQIFPHHFDLAMNWFSGRIVPGSDPADEESADEQMNFGFVTGDSLHPEPYFYVTAYPVPAGWSDLKLPLGAQWQSDGWIGAILPYQRLLEVDKPNELLLNYLRSVRDHGAALMR